MNYHILYSILYCKQFYELSRTLQNCKQFSELSHTLQYCKQMSLNGLLQVDKVITELTKCLALNRILHGAGHWKLARSHANLAEAYLDLKGSSHSALSSQIFFQRAKAWHLQQTLTTIIQCFLEFFSTCFSLTPPLFFQTQRKEISASYVYLIQKIK